MLKGFVYKIYNMKYEKKLKHFFFKKSSNITYITLPDDWQDETAGGVIEHISPTAKKIVNNTN